MLAFKFFCTVLLKIRIKCIHFGLLTKYIPKKDLVSTVFSASDTIHRYADIPMKQGRKKLGNTPNKWNEEVGGDIQAMSH